MTAIPPMAAPSAPAARTTGTAGAGGSEGGDQIAAVFSALVAAVSGELAASGQASTPEVDVPAECPEGSDATESAELAAGDLHDDARAAAAASLLGMVTSLPRSESPRATAHDAGDGTAADDAVTIDSTLADVDLEAPPDMVVAPPAASQVDSAPVATAATTEEGDVAPGTDLVASPGDDGDAQVQPDAPTDRPGEPAPAPADAVPDTADADGPTDRSTPSTVADPVPSGPTGVGASTPPTAAAATNATSATAHPAAPALPDQLVEVLVPLRRAPDGTHRMAIQLRPDELGDVHIEFQVRGNEISLNLRADLASTNELLRDSLAQLRAELDAAGFRSGTLDVNDHGDPRAQGGRPGHDHATAHGRPSGDASADDAATTDQARQSAVAGLDLRL